MKFKLAIFIVGVLIGIAVGHFLFSAEDISNHTGIIEKNRQLQPRDTTGSVSPTVEVRYDTIRQVVRDTIKVSVPYELTEDPQILANNPVRITPRTVQLTRYDAQDMRYEQDVFKVPRVRLRVRPFAGLRRQNLFTDNRHPINFIEAGVRIEYKPRFWDRTKLEVDARALTDMKSNNRFGVGVRLIY